jgi:hypothetical protein
MPAGRAPLRPRGGASRRSRHPTGAALTKIFLDEIERSLLTASGVTAAADTPSVSHPQLGGISFLHRFGSALNHHVHLHACVTDGVFVPAPSGRVSVNLVRQSRLLPRTGPILFGTAIAVRKVGQASACHPPA